jgi:hypothetical protein
MGTVYLTLRDKTLLRCFNSRIGQNEGEVEQVVHFVDASSWRIALNVHI